MLDFLQNYPDMHQFMPSERREIVKLPREWIINIGATVVNVDFLNFVRQAIHRRNQELEQRRNLLIKMDPQLANAFRNSTSVSRK